MQDQLLEGRYRLLRQLGEGGMGQVWEAEDELLGRYVAIKLISLLAGGGSQGTQARARFLREAQITARLQHPNIVTIHDLGETGTENARVPFLVMELVRGEGLDSLLHRGAVTLPYAARWGAQICDALGEAHAVGITHRDIKPSNILITPSGTVKVLDFGIARAADHNATADRLTRSGFIVGTPPYMAPEQARGHPEPHSDLYALGCVLFELITGRLPFLADDTVGYLSAHLTQDPPRPSSLSTHIPPAWDNLVLALLSKDPGMRHPDAASLAQELRQLDQNTAVQPPPARTLPLEQTQQPSRHPRPSHAEGLFAISWTGRERLSAYTTSWERRWLVGAGVPVAVTLAGLLVSLAMSPAALSQDDASGWALAAQVLLVVGSLPLLLLLWLLIFLPLSHDRSAWSVQVGPLGIRTTNGLDMREYKWSKIKTLTIEEAVNNDVRCAAGLHIKFRKGANPSAYRPAGWPYRFGEKALVRNGWVPICVFGPMTDWQRTLLTEALARYGQGKWEDEAWAGVPPRPSY
ncbi:serine/threonine-protein kinase [Streptomyces sp. NPDC005803]|uniref:serine/threonine-protein kinase n=1 Tax=Streptomyces sp. NPDC005803 TaxID=3154297 RepID=UPI0033D2E305